MGLSHEELNLGVFDPFSFWHDNETNNILFQLYKNCIYCTGCFYLIFFLFILEISNEVFMLKLIKENTHEYTQSYI